METLKSVIDKATPAALKASSPSAPPQAQGGLNTDTTTQNVEVDEGIFEEPEDSGLDVAGTDSSTTSLSSSVRDYTYENGRRYHSFRFREGQYFMPNDELEQERLDLYHHMFLIMLQGKLHTAPLDNPQRVLDIGTGTGIWAIDFAELHPQAEVIGTDLSPIQPSWVTNNLKFEVDDMEETWTYKKSSFDYIHFRTMCGSFRNWDAILTQAYEFSTPPFPSASCMMVIVLLTSNPTLYRHLRPGGFTEFQDYGVELFFSDGRRAVDTPMAHYIDVLAVASEKSGRPLRVARGMKHRMERAGYEDVTERVCIWPVGGWPKDQKLKELGKWTKVGLLDGLQAFCISLLTRHEGWSTARVEELCRKARIDLMSKSANKYYFQGWFVHGRKAETQY